MKRKVIVKHDPAKHVYFVRYVDRKHGGRYCAGQFDDRHFTPADVERWVRRHIKLELA